MKESRARIVPEDDAGLEAQRQADARAVARALDGDLGAYDELIERYQRRATAVAYRLLGNIEDAMDVCQEAFVKGYRSLATLKEPPRFGAWLMRIVSNLSLNYRRGRRPHFSLSTGDDESAQNESWMEDRRRGAPTGAAAVEAAEAQEAVSRAMESLPEPQRLALVLFAIEGLPQKEVAAIMECSVEMVKWNVFQARKALKEKLADFLEE